MSNDEAEALVQESQRLADEDHYDEALELIECSLQLDDSNKVAWHTKGIICVELGRLDDALSANAKALALDPNAINYWRLRGSIMIKFERWDDVLECSRRWQALAPHNPKARLSSAMALNNLGRHNEALSESEALIELEPLNPIVWRNRMLAFAGLRN